MKETSDMFRMRVFVLMICPSVEIIKMKSVNFLI